MSTRLSRQPVQVVIAGGGVAGLEALLALRDLAADRVGLTLVSPDKDFMYKPMIVAEPFSAGRARRRALAPIARELGARFIQQPFVQVAPETRSVELGDGSELGYDLLVLCVGARSRPAYRRVLTFDAAADPLRMTGVLADLEGGWSKSISFLVPPGATWPLPIYELALMTQRQAWSTCCDDVSYTIVTPEPAPLAIFGTRASAAVADLLCQRGIDVATGTYARQDADGRLMLVPGDRPLHAARTVALPVPEGPRIPGLPADEHGFIPIDEHGRVRGLDDVYAAGDSTTFPIKQGGLATQQADAAAEHIAARVGAPIDPQPFRPVLRGKLLTGDHPLFVHHEIRGGAGDGGVSDVPLWWPAHKVCARYLAPWLEPEAARQDPEPPRPALDVDVLLPRARHEHPLALDPYGPLPLARS